MVGTGKKRGMLSLLGLVCAETRKPPSGINGWIPDVLDEVLGENMEESQPSQVC